MKRLWIICFTLIIMLAGAVPVWAMSHGGHGGHSMPMEESMPMEHSMPMDGSMPMEHSMPMDSSMPMHGSMPMQGYAATNAPYQIIPKLPDTLEIGKPSEIVIAVRDDKGPVKGLLVHMTATNFFGRSAHGAGHNSTMNMDNMNGSGGSAADHGQSSGEATSHSSMMADSGSESMIMGEEIGDGLYRLSWTPEKDGRVTLTIFAGEGQMQVPADVQGPAPNPFVLGFFGLFVVATLGYTYFLRKQSRKEVSIHEPA